MLFKIKPIMAFIFLVLCAGSSLHASKTWCKRAVEARKNQANNPHYLAKVKRLAILAAQAPETASLETEVSVATVETPVAKRLVSRRVSFSLESSEIKVRQTPVSALERDSSSIISSASSSDPRCGFLFLLGLASIIYYEENDSDNEEDLLSPCDIDSVFGDAQHNGVLLARKN